MAVLSLNGSFNYPIELKQSFSVDGIATFNSGISQGIDNFSNGQHSFTCGNSCTADSDYSISYGINSYVGYDGQYSFAGGESCSSYGKNSYAIGYMSATRTKNGNNCKNSFVWQGNENETTYYSFGNGTFCINPKNYSIESNSVPTSTLAVCGFFIGSNCLTDYISSESEKRILKNENRFVESQEFGKNVTFDGMTIFNNQNTFNGAVTFNGSTSVPNNNDPSTDVISDSGIANHYYVNELALSSISTVGQYFNDMESIDFDEFSEFSTPLKFVKFYVTSSINNVDSFIEGNNPNSAASREYSLNLATSASNYIFDRDNTFNGTNTFRNLVDIANSFTTRGSAKVDLRNGDIIVREPFSEVEMKDNTIATEKYTRCVATSGVNAIINGSNSYNGYNTYSKMTEFNGGVMVYSTIKLNKGASADFKDGNLIIKNPSKTSIGENEPSTTDFSRYASLSAVNELLKSGGTFGGKVTFNNNVAFNNVVNVKSSNSYLYVKTMNLEDSSENAASTKFVKDSITQTISTSSVSVKNLILNGNSTSSVNNFTTTNNFLGKNIYVSTMNLDCEDTHAASCEFVRKNIDMISPFDLFDTKFLDYTLPKESPWKISGTPLYRAEGYEVAYQHILSDKNGGTHVQEIINGQQIDYYQAKDGHKIVMWTNSSQVESIFAETGIAWFYILNTTSGGECVKLPMTTYNFKSTLTTSNVGVYVPASLPSHTHDFYIGRSADGSHGSSTNTPEELNMHHGGGKYPDDCCSKFHGVTTGPSWSIPVGNTVQPPATNMLLYFYCK